MTNRSRSARQLIDGARVVEVGDYKRAVAVELGDERGERLLDHAVGADVADGRAGSGPPASRDERQYVAGVVRQLVRHAARVRRARGPTPRRGGEHSLREAAAGALGDRDLLELVLDKAPGSALCGRSGCSTQRKKRLRSLEAVFAPW